MKGDLKGDRPKPRGSKLIPPSLLIVIALVFASLLVLLFPTQRTLERWMNAKPDHLSVVFLELTLRSRPNDRTVRLALVKQLLQIGRLADAEKTLRPLGEGGDTDPDVALLIIELAIQRYLELPEDSVARSASRTRVDAMMVRLAEAKPPEHVLLRLYELASATSGKETRLAVARSLAASASHGRSAWFERAGEIHLEFGELTAASEAFELAARADLARSGSRRLAMRGLEALIAAGRNADAAVKMDALLEKFPKDRALIEKALSLALGLQNLNRAADLGQALMELRGDDATLVASQVDVQLAAGRRKEAVVLLRRFVALRPEDRAARERLARLEEWTGSPSEALEVWSELMERYASKEYLDQMERLSKMTWDRSKQLEVLLLRRELGEGWKAGHIEEVSTLYEELGDPEGARSFLLAHLGQHFDDRIAWKLLALLDERTGDLASAVDVWKSIGEKFSLTPAEQQRRAELFWRIRKPRTALLLLVNGKRSSYLDDLAYWRSVGELAWTLDEPREALEAYRMMRKRGWLLPHEAERLMRLARSSGSSDEAVEVALETHKKTKRPEFLLFSMDLVSEKGRWEELGRLVKLSETKENRKGLEGSSHYWMIVAAYEQRMKQYDRAKTSYRRALGLDSKQMYAKTGLLWTMIQSGDTKGLEAAMALWRREAWGEREFWGLYGAGYLALDQPKESLAWFSKEYKSGAGDDWLLPYASALDRAQRFDAAWRVRRTVVDRFRRRGGQVSLDSSSTSGRDLSIEQGIAYAEAISVGGSGRETDAVVTQLVNFAPKDARVVRFAAAHYLSQGRTESARQILGEVERDSMRILASQRLALAFEENDRDGVGRVLEEAGDLLTTGERIEVLRRLGREEDAIELAITKAASDQPNAESDALLVQADGMVRDHSSTAEAGLAFRRLELLEIREVDGRVVVTGDEYAVSLDLAVRDFDKQGPALSLLGADREVDGMMALRWRQSRGFTELAVGSNIRADGNVLMGRLSQRYRFLPPLSVSADLLLNEIWEAPSLLRAFVVRDRASLGLQLELTKRIHATSTLSWFGFRSRARETLGNGYDFSVDAGYRVWLGAPALRLRAGGTFGANEPTSRETAERFTTPFAGPPIEGLLPGPSGSFGLGARLESGDVGGVPGLFQSPSYFLDVFGAWLFPAQAILYSAEVGAGLPIGRGSEICLTGGLSRLGSTATGETRIEVEVRYVRRLWP